MYMNKFIFTEILLISIILVVVDASYLYSMKHFFNSQIKLIQGADIKMNIYAAILCYIALVYGLYYFIIKDKRPLTDAFIFGIVIYAVYELTTKALLQKWSWSTVVLDTLWGGILFTITTYLVYTIQKYI